MVEWFYACAVTKYQNFSSILHFWYSLFQFLQVFTNSCELNPTLAISPILCILMRLPDGDSPCCTRVLVYFATAARCHCFDLLEHNLYCYILHFCRCVHPTMLVPVFWNQVEHKIVLFYFIPLSSK